jgi:hypothetical protein
MACTLLVWPRKGSASVDDSAGAAVDDSDRHPVDRNNVEIYFPVTLQYLLLKLNRRHDRPSLPFW